MRTSFGLFISQFWTFSPFYFLIWDLQEAWNVFCIKQRRLRFDLCTFNVEIILVRMMRLGCIYDAGRIAGKVCWLP